MDYPTKKVLNTEIHAFTLIKTIELIKSSIQTGRSIKHVAINAAKLNEMQINRDLYDSVVSSDIINADGQSIVWASKFLGNPLPERVAGIDLMEALVKLAHKEELTCYFFGAKEEIVNNVINKYTQIYSPKIIAGFRNGYYSEDEEKQIAIDIASSKADILFVAITSPKKELFLDKYKEIINVPFIMGVGGSFDVVAGITKRAPLWMQRMGLEWFYRFIQEPRRMWKRYLVGNTKFIFLVVKQRLGLYKNPWDVTNG